MMQELHNSIGSTSMRRQFEFLKDNLFIVQGHEIAGQNLQRQATLHVLAQKRAQLSTTMLPKLTRPSRHGCPAISIAETRF